MRQLEEDQYLFVEYRKPGKYGTDLRPATDKEKQKALKIRQSLINLYKQRDMINAQIKNIELKCKHKVSYDIEGFPYDIRSCAGCNEDQGLV